MIEILIVEDEYTERRELARIMEEVTGKEHIRCASSCDSAMEMIAERAPDLLLLDIMLRGRSGFEVAQFVRERRLACRIIILTAYHEFEFANQALALNIQEYLLKPVRPAVLLQKVRKVLQQPAERTAEGRRLWPGLECGLWEEVVPPACGTPNLIVVGVLNAPLTGSAEAGFLARANPGDAGWTEGAGQRLVGYCRSREGEEVAAARRLREIWSARLPESHRLLGVGVGAFASEPGDLAGSYYTANLAVKGRLLYPDEEICRYTPGVAAAYPVRLESRLLHQIRTGGQPELQRSCEQICAAFIQGCRGDVLLLEHWLGLLCAALSRRCAESSMRYLPQVDLFAVGRPEELCLRLQTECMAVRNLLLGQTLPDHPLVQTTVAIIQARFREPLKLREVAREQFVNPAYLGRLFHAQMGQSFRDYLTRVRMQHAAELLREKRSVAQVAEAVGYGDANYFSRVYKAQFGCPPTEGRDQEV